MFPATLMGGIISLAQKELYRPQIQYDNKWDNYGHNKTNLQAQTREGERTKENPRIEIFYIHLLIIIIHWIVNLYIYILFITYYLSDKLAVIKKTTYSINIHWIKFPSLSKFQEMKKFIHGLSIYFFSLSN
jgi:hypothetical protein